MSKKDVIRLRNQRIMKSREAIQRLRIERMERENENLLLRLRISSLEKDKAGIEHENEIKEVRKENIITKRKLHQVESEKKELEKSFAELQKSKEKEKFSPDRPPYTIPADNKERIERGKKVLSDMQNKEKFLHNLDAVPETEKKRLDIKDMLPSTDIVVNMLKAADEVILPERDKPERTEAIKNLEKKYPKAEYVNALLSVRSAIQEEEINAAAGNRSMNLDIASLPAFQKILELEEMLNSTMRSRDANERLWSANMKDEIWKEANELSIKNRLERLRVLNPENLQKLVEKRGKIAKEWLKETEREWNQMFGRPDNIFGIYLLASLMPVPGLAAVLPVALPALKTLSDMMIMMFAKIRENTVLSEKNGLGRSILADAASSSVLRAYSDIADRNGMSTGEVLNAYMESIRNGDSTYNAVKFIAQNAGMDEKSLQEYKANIGDAMKSLNMYRKDYLDIYAFDIVRNENGEPEAKAGESGFQNLADMELKELYQGIDSSELSDYLVSSGIAGRFASFRPVQAVMVSKLVKAGFFSDDENRLKLSEHLMNRCLPSIAKITEENREDVINDILVSYGSCTQKHGKYKELTAEELASANLEFLIASSSLGRKKNLDELYRRIENMSTEKFVDEIMKLGDRIVHPYVKVVEETANVKSSEIERTGPDEMENHTEKLYYEKTVEEAETDSEILDAMENDHIADRPEKIEEMEADRPDRMFEMEADRPETVNEMTAKEEKDDRPEGREVLSEEKVVKSEFLEKAYEAVIVLTDSKKGDTDKKEKEVGFER